ncbi:sugar-binding transcriptional regulator [Allostreptomyces psammosilenae]|uniref:DNA-binding transcriptional regulator LsrR (DeoR family) n=1 Tax=Allostreptomyces psammosilenae TaxID=1892865 RepID=A0A852ZYZ4_9ACTN|nr:sugar-binding domain-containing protein [Allostreptomyces psammosilenae]NYI07285.1 DNA-binding transcriptional regulator LsrR (DeoR family) [Allostreptomyces psammosilenae]
MGRPSTERHTAGEERIPGTEPPPAAQAPAPTPPAAPIPPATPALPVTPAPPAAPAPSAADPGPAELLRTAAIARRFYLDGVSKVEIAKEYGLSRFKVARILEAAVDSGIVRIEIRLPARIDAERSEALRRAYGLRHAVVVDPRESAPAGPHEAAGTADAADGSGGPVRRAIGTAGAALLTEVVEADDVLGLASGQTVNAVFAALTRLPRCTVVQLTGTTAGVTLADGPVEAVRHAARLTGGLAVAIYAPLILSDAATTAALRAQPGIAEAFSHFPSVTKAVVSIGAWSRGNSSVHDSLAPREQAQLAERGVVGEVCGHVLDATGRPVVSHLPERTLSVSLERLRAVPEVIAVAGGAAKGQAITAALRSGVISGLVTDAAAADVALRAAASAD